MEVVKDINNLKMTAKINTHKEPLNVSKIDFEEKHIIVFSDEGKRYKEKVGFGAVERIYHNY